MTFTFTIQGVSWSVRYGAFFGWPPCLAAATTMGRATAIKNNGYCPDAPSLAHEFHHVLTTSWLRYLCSYTIGRLWGDAYWRNEEIAANTYGAAHATDPDFVTAANTMHAAMPAGTMFETITHPV